MTLKGIVLGDIVECDVRGDLFFAKVIQPEHTPLPKKGEIYVKPISNGRGSLKLVTSRQIKTRFKRMKS